MGIYGTNYFSEQEVLNEKNLVNNLKANIVNIKNLKEQWKKYADSFVKHRWIFRLIKNREQMAEVKKMYNVLLEDDNTSTKAYNNYKKAFDFIADFFNLPAKEIIIENLTITKDEEDKAMYKINLKYSKGFVKVKLPKGAILTHVSPADNITALNPSFKSKVKGKYMYPSPRCFFTVAPNTIKKSQAGLEGKKLTTYITKEDFVEAYIDPTYSDFKDCSVYIETQKPIPVEKLQKNLTLLDNRYQELKDKNYADLIKNWKMDSDKVSVKDYKSSQVSNADYEKLKSAIETMRAEDISYQDYKKAFTFVCKYAHITPDGVIIVSYKLDKSKEDDKNVFELKYSFNSRKIQIPDTIKLYHTSQVDGIKELNPTFRGKSQKGYLYDKPRVYLTIRKKLPKLAADYTNEKTYLYEVVDTVKEAYVDPLLPNSAFGAVYVVTDKPIKVKQISGDQKKQTKEESVKEEALMLECFCLQNDLEIID